MSNPNPPAEPWREEGVARARTLVIGSMVPGVLIIWGLWIAYQFFDLDPFGGRPADPAARARDPWLFLTLVLLGTAAAAALGWLMYRRAARLYRRGVAVPGRIAKRLYEGGGLVRVQYAYTVGGREYTKAGPLPRDLADEYERGTRPLTVLADPARPGRAMIVDKP